MENLLFSVCCSVYVYEFSRQEYWSGLPFPTPGDLPDPGIELVSLVSSALTGRFFTTSAARETHLFSVTTFITYLH